MIRNGLVLGGLVPATAFGVGFGNSGDLVLGTSQGDVSSGDILADGGNADATLGGTGETPGDDGEIIAGGQLIMP